MTRQADGLESHLATTHSGEDHRSSQEKQAEAERRALMADGDEISQGLRGVEQPPDEEPRTGTAGALVKRAHNWLGREPAYWSRWHVGPPANSYKGLGTIGLMNSMFGGGINAEGQYFVDHSALAPTWR